MFPATHRPACWRPHLVSALICAAAVATHSYAAVLPVTDVTINPSPAGDLNTNATITSITVDGVTYADLESITGVTFPGNPERVWGQNAADPGSDEAAVLGLNYGTGVLNVGANTNFQYGRTLAPDELLFIIRDGKASESITLRLIDASNALVGSYALNIGSGEFQNTFSKQVDLKRESGGNLNNRDRTGESFRLSDFTGTGDLSTVTGFRVTTNGSTFDVAAVGVVVPEPTSLALVAVGCLCVFPRRRR